MAGIASNEPEREENQVKPAELQMLKGKKIAGDGSATARGGAAGAMSKREQALARKRELLEARRKTK
jgi:hypothetical protein